jgi:hypothetical protein
MVGRGTAAVLAHGGGHMVAGDRNDAFAEAVVTFIQGPKHRR